MNILVLIKLAHHCQRVICGHTPQSCQGKEVKISYMSDQAQEGAIPRVHHNLEGVLNSSQELGPRCDINTRSWTKVVRKSYTVIEAKPMTTEPTDQPQMGHKLNIQKHDTPTELLVCKSSAIGGQY